MTDFTNINEMPEWAKQMACDKANARRSDIEWTPSDIPGAPALTELALMCWQYCEEPVDPDLLIVREAYAQWQEARGEDDLAARHRNGDWDADLLSGPTIVADRLAREQAQPRDLPAQDEVEARNVTFRDAKDIAAAVVQSACESDPAPTDHPNTIQINVDELEVIVRVSVENHFERGFAAAAIAALDRHRAGDDALREENARLRGVVDALAVLMPIQVHDGRDYAEVFFADGTTHSTQAMTMNPQHWRDLADAYARAALTGRQG